MARENEEYAHPSLVDGSEIILHSHPGGGGSVAIIHLDKDTATENVGGSNGSKHQVSWDNEIRKDTGYTHSNSTNNSRIYVDNDGRYRIVATVSVEQGGNARTTYMLYVRVNGSTEIKRCVSRNYCRGSSYGDASCTMTTQLDLNANDYIEIQTEIDDTDSSYTSYTMADQCECIVEKVE